MGERSRGKSSENKIPRSAKAEPTPKCISTARYKEFDRTRASLKVPVPDANVVVSRTMPQAIAQAGKQIPKKGEKNNRT
ncbi:hypothetical protein VTH06DRAFT_2600 [Thermothelomyces fergusii]